jgi:hypothetical protein
MKKGRDKAAPKQRQTSMAIPAAGPDRHPARFGRRVEVEVPSAT